MENEIWKDIPNYEGMYQVSDLGRVKSLKRVVLDKPTIYKTIKERILKHGKTRHGYQYVILAKNGINKSYTIHKLVAKCFLNYDSNNRIIVIDHIDANKCNNTEINLQIITSRLNCSKDRKNKTSQYTGVSWLEPNKKWVATIMINKKHNYLGLFENEYDAHLAYQQAVANII